MKRLTFTLTPRSAFGTPLAGDTLFGQLCWALRWRLGEDGLIRLLDGYTEGRPFAVVSDAFPAGHVPRPALPAFLLDTGADPDKRKAERRRQWLPTSHAGRPLRDWLANAADLGHAAIATVTQNTINRHTGTTGSNEFAPRQLRRIEFSAPARDTAPARLDVHVLLDDARLPVGDLHKALADIGATGYGRDASTGLGKFDLAAPVATPWPAAAQRGAVTLAPCAPDPAALDAAHCHYQPLARFGRHGGTAALQGGGGPFKKPVLLLRTGAFLRFAGDAPLFHGTGLGGERAPISVVLPATVMQGYAPLLPLDAEIAA